MFSNRARLWVLIAFVTVSGFLQGMLLPLLAIILEQSGVSSSVNGLHATGLYLGILIASPFMEKPLQKLGYKPMILIGGMLMFIAIALFPIWQTIWLWFVLRLLVGIGDQMVSFSAQTWITSTTPVNKRGKIIAIYGLFFSLGFAFGPLMTRLVQIHESLPFIIAALLCLSVWVLVCFLKNEYVAEDDDIEMVQITSTVQRFFMTTKLAWIALLGPLTYGILEALLHGIFPIYGLRIGHDIKTISLIIPFFSISTLITQIPLGVLGDKIGRQKVLSIVTSLGAIVFLIGAQFEQSIVILILTFALSGMLLGSLFSLGLSYMADILPRQLLPAGNIMCGVTFSIGSIIGPYLGGLFIDLFPNLSLFYIIVALLFIITVLFSIKKK
ncbi:MFS transporter [Amphibacillus sp. MSJ-3]|uniref:MFS transporter n=1 Tax=Amphibacillus sp. MSJ-3 TaxID=2841505 RepID=UPI001C0ED9CD|nr:MFS transporter [Amphibacillus sp. MSJ-3]MBU5595027.1 MFS transporter [Amphibacillus sp. MSJ-3]